MLEEMGRQMLKEEVSRKGAKPQSEDANERTAEARAAEAQMTGARRLNEQLKFFAPLRLCVRSLFPGSRVPRLKAASFAFLFMLCLPVAAFADRLLLVDGTTLEVDEAWDDAEGVWYRRGGMTNFVERARVRKIERTPRREGAKGRRAGACTKSASVS